MKKMRTNIAAIIISLAMSFGLAACSSGDVEAENPAESESSEGALDAETLQAIEDFDEVDVLSLQEGIMSNDDYFVVTEYEIQNKSAEATITNLSYEYVIADQNGELIELDGESFFSDDYLVRLEPRNRAKLQIMTHVGDEPGHEEWGQYVVKYSYDMDGVRYVVDLVNKMGTSMKVEDASNAALSDKHVLDFKSSEYLPERVVKATNVGDQPIRTLVAKIMVRDAEGVVTSVKDIEYVELGEEVIEPGEVFDLEISYISTEEGGSLEVVSYSYDVSIADESGFNHFDLNLITGECCGSTNTLALEQDVDVDSSEVESLIAALGRRVEETSLDVESIEEGNSNGKEDRVNLKGANSLLGLPGELVVYRDYDSLLLCSFRFTPESQDESTKGYLINALKEIFGENYSVKSYGYKDGEYFVWVTDRVEVELSWDYDLRFTVRVLTD